VDLLWIFLHQVDLLLQVLHQRCHFHLLQNNQEEDLHHLLDLLHQNQLVDLQWQWDLDLLVLHLHHLKNLVLQVAVDLVVEVKVETWQNNLLQRNSKKFQMKKRKMTVLSRFQRRMPQVQVVDSVVVAVVEI
jgi:hypothetical protein